MEAPEQTPVIKMPLYKLIIDTKYQRPSDLKRAKKIADEFEPALAGVLEVAPTGDDRFAVIDGQHRLLAMRELSIPEWWVKINHLSTEAQAATFVKLQRQRKNIKPFEQHKAALVAGDPKAAALETMLNERGLTFSSNNGNKEHGVRAITSVYRMYDMNGLVHTKRVMDLIRNIWPEDSTLDIYQAPMIRGFSTLLRQYPEASDARIIEKMRVISPLKLLRDATAVAATESGSSGVAASIWKIVVKNYNKGLSTSRLGYKPESK